MATLTVGSVSPEARVAPVFTGTARWVVAAILIAGPLLQMLEFLLTITTDDAAERVAFWAAQPDRIGLSMASGVLAPPFLLGGVAVLVALTRQWSPRLAWVAGGLMTFAMCGLTGAQGYEIAAFSLAQAGETATATLLAAGENVNLPAAVMLIMFLAGAALGTLLLAWVTWRSPLVPRLVPLCIVAFAVLDFAIAQVMLSHLVNLIGFAIAAWGVGTGYVRREA